MPFLQNIADRAQTALQGSPLAAHLDRFTGTSSPPPHDQSHQTSPNDPAAGNAAHAGKSYALESIQHQLRSLQQQYASSTTPLQRVITTQKGVSIDYEGVSRDTKTYSKELYIWGQTEGEDIKDVSDRLAYLNFVHGSLSSTLSSKLSASRGALKALRDAEAALQPRRNIRSGIVLQINRLKNEGQRGAAVDRKISELQDSLRRAEEEDSQHEKEIEILKRKSLKESEEAKWDALREYGEKLILISQASTSILNALPSIPPSAESPYTGARTTASTRASLQRALDNWVTGHINVPSLPNLSHKDSIDSDTRSFGESHASELSSINSHSSGTSVPAASPRHSPPPVPVPVPVHHSSSNQHPIDPAHLNNSPAPIIPGPSNSNSSSLNTATPIVTASDTPVVASPASPGSVPPAEPTVAETGIPISSGTSGPGPASGSLRRTSDTKGDSRPPGYGSGSTGWVSAEEEKKRLQRQDRDQVLHTGGSSSSYHPPAGPPPPAHGSAAPYESAEDEKKRLEREERERVLQLGAGGSGASGSNNPYRGPPPPGSSNPPEGEAPGYEPPPYQG